MQEERQENESLDGGNEETPQRQPWERLPTETSSAFTAFTLYRDMGRERSLDKVGLELSKKAKSRKRARTGHICVWARDNRWVERARAYDEWRSEESRKIEEIVLLREQEEAAGYRREMRRRNKWVAEQVHQRIQSFLIGEDGQPRALDATQTKALRELVLAAEKLGAVELRGLYGLEPTIGAGQDMPAEMAEAWERFQLDIAIRRKSSAGDPPLPS
jgi:hypothetical protein